MKSLLFLVAVSCSSMAYGQEKLTPEKEPVSRYTLFYGSPSWNTSPTKINSAFLVIRDRASRKLLQVQLEETAPDSSEFKGHFQFQLKNQRSITPEVYIPPQNLRGELDQFYQLIQAQKISRKPVIIKRTRNQNIIDVYDTKEQAQRAWQAFQESQALTVQSKVPNTPVLKEQENPLEDAAEIAKSVAAQMESDRIRLEQIERQKIQDRIDAQKKLDAAERQRKVREAKNLVDEGMKLYLQKNYQEAEAKFSQSIELDPSNKEFYYKYGVTLYKNEKYSDALVIFNATSVSSELQNEKNYFMALSHFKLNENKRALEYFEKVSRSNDPTLAPSSSFYVGVIHFNNEHFEESKVAFETVLDTSKDPKLDEKAEEYIEAIAKAQILAKQRSKKWLLSGTAGLMYDSNVLLAPDLQSAQGSSNKEGDVRLVTVGDVTYKAYVGETSNLNINANANLINSSKNDLAYADPWLYSVRAPYSKQLSGKSPGKITFTPAYETLFMAESGNTTKKNILNSVLGQVSYLKSNSRKWFSNYLFEYRMDDFSISSSVGANNLDANKFSLGTTQSLLIGKKSTEVLAGSLKYIRNQAAGDDRIYDRYEFGVTFAKPIWKSSAWTSSLNYYFLDFPSSSLNRKDNNVTFTTSVAKPINDWFTWGVVGSLSNNVSTESDSYSYTRYTLMTTATFNTGF